MFEPEQIYKRSELHDKYGGQRQGGISTPRALNAVLLFSGDTGEQYGYSDGWDSSSGLYLYTGEGQIGDMEFVRGNVAIRDHASNGKELHMFQYVRPGYVKYIGQMAYSDHRYVTASDVNGHARKAIVFELKPV